MVVVRRKRVRGVASSHFVFFVIFGKCRGKLSIEEMIFIVIIPGMIYMCTCTVTVTVDGGGMNDGYTRVFCDQMKSNIFIPPLYIFINLC